MEINTILLIIALLIIIVLGSNPPTEPFGQDISKTNIQQNKVIYDTVPYSSSGLFYDYVIGSPYWYNPLDYWLNPYVYYTWGGLYGSYPSSSYSYTTSVPHVKRRHIRRTRHYR